MRGTGAIADHPLLPPTNTQENSFYLFKPIFRCDAKTFALGPGVGLDPQRQNFALGIPTCWYLKTPDPRRQTQNVRRPRRQTLKFALPPTQTPDASQWNIGGKIFALAMYISCCLCQFHLRRAPNANPVFSGIWALELRNSC